jgi:SET domain-containing protein
MKKYEIKESDIHGKGVFAKETIATEEFIEVGIYMTPGYIQVSPMGDYVNHSDTPNSILSRKDGHYNMFAIKEIQPGDEITISYNDENAPKIIQRYVPAD